MTILPERVRRARVECGLSMNDLAQGICSRAFIHQIESGQARPSLEVIAQIATRTRRPLAYFTDGRSAAERIGNLTTDLSAVARRLDRLALNLDPATSERLAIRLIADNLRVAIRIIGTGLLNEG